MERRASRAQLQQQLSQLQKEFDALFDDCELLKEEVNVLRLDIRRLFKKWQKDHQLLRQPSGAEKLAHEVMELRKDMQAHLRVNDRSEQAQRVQAKLETERKPSLQERYEGLMKVPWRREADTITRRETSPRRIRERTRSARKKTT